MSLPPRSVFSKYERGGALISAPQLAHDYKQSLDDLTKSWGSPKDVSLYLSRCQVDTSESLVRRVWEKVSALRPKVGTVVDFGAGDGRFARGGGVFDSYVGFEIDAARFKSARLPDGVQLREECAFSANICDADLAIGNPPYVRNQDLPAGWREHASQVIKSRTLVQPSGLANAWQYFLLLSLASTASDGLVALVIPYEWVSRPSSRQLREYIRNEKWSVSVYRLHDSAFSNVLTTSSITIIDKSKADAKWMFFTENERGGFDTLLSETSHQDGVLPYLRVPLSHASLRAKRGLSPGTQKVLTLTEPERARLGLAIGTDVVECVTSLKPLPISAAVLDAATFREHYRDGGRKCWLIRSDGTPSRALSAYLTSVSAEHRQTATCNDREVWWKFAMPQVPGVLVSSGFTGNTTKAVANTVGARAVGSVCGVYGMSRGSRKATALFIRELSLSDRIVSHSNGLKKLEINQLNALLETMRST